MKSFSFSPSELEVSTVLEESLSKDVLSSLSQSVVTWHSFSLRCFLQDKKQDEYLAKFQRKNLTTANVNGKIFHNTCSGGTRGKFLYCGLAALHVTGVWRCLALCE